MRLDGARAGELVEEDRGKQHDAEEHLVPVGLDAAEEQALLDDAKGQGAEDAADHRPVSAAQKAFRRRWR